MLVKYSPKRQQLLGSIQDSLEYEADEEFHQTVTLSKVYVTRWTVKATTFTNVLSNYDSRMQLWDISMQDSLDRETRSRIIGSEGQLKHFEFVYGLNLGNTLYNMTDNLSKTIQKENCSAIDYQRSANLTMQALQGMRQLSHFMKPSLRKHLSILSLSSLFSPERERGLTIRQWESIFR